MKFFIIAGEASADLHGARLVEALKESEKGKGKSEKSACAQCEPHGNSQFSILNSQFVGLGGDKMQAAGVKLLQHYREMAFMGVVAVLKNLDKVRRNFQIAKEGLLRERPDCLILIDYPSFNLKIATFCRKHLPNTKIYYYIPPKVWAWKTYRVHKIARLCDGILAIFPFEVDFYARYGYKAVYVGNPTANEVKEWLQPPIPKKGETPKQTPPLGGCGAIALLPGSRRHEIEHCLPIMLRAAAKFPDYQILIAAAPAIEKELYENIIAKSGVHELLKSGHLEISPLNSQFSILNSAHAAIVNSGTATLEAALLDCPQVSVYHVAAGRLLGLLRPFLFKIPHFTLVNILAGKEVIKELIAYLLTEENITAELQRLLTDAPYRQQMLDNYAQIRTTLGTQDAAQTAAQHILSSLT